MNPPAAFAGMDGEWSTISLLANYELADEREDA
jgi:hypothetical protein